MASQFIGLTVNVTLHSPPGAQVRGLVEDVAAGQLNLSDVFFPQNGYHLPAYRVLASQIADLEVDTGLNAKPHPAGQHEPAYHASDPPSQPSAPQLHTETAQNVSATQQLADPAILSMGARPPRPHAPANIRIPTAQTGHNPDGSRVPNEPNTAATLNAPFNGLNSNGASSIAARGELDSDTPVAAKEADTPDIRSSPAGKRNRRNGKPSNQKDTGSQTRIADKGQGQSLRPLPSGARKHAGKAEAWREGDFLQEMDEQISDLPNNGYAPAGTSSKRKARRSRLPKTEDTDGWATEEATDIQGMGEFDFAGNLSKFDKKTVFNQIRADDTIADENRLVSFNRLPARNKSDTTSMRKLLPTENVLDRQENQAKWNSEAGDSYEDSASDVGVGSGRSSRRAMSRQASRQTSSRKGSAIAGPGSGHLHNQVLQGLQTSSLTSSPKATKFSPSGSPHGNLQTRRPSSKPSLRLVPSNRLCPSVSALQMLDVERIAEVELGLTEDMMTENAARGVAEVAMSVLNPTGKRAETSNPNTLPIAVIMAGNTKSGARAVAAGRHLRNHGVRLILCVLGLERDEELLDGVRRQIHIYRSSGGKLIRCSELASSLKSLDAPPELVIDGLLGMHVALEDLRHHDQLTAYELISWANSSKASILAVDVPTGLDASTGEMSVLEEQQLCVQAKYIVALGAPKSGLLNAMIAGQGQDWQLFVCDIGISNTAWRKYGTRRRHGVDFASEWVVPLRYQSGVDQNDSGG